MRKIKRLFILLLAVLAISMISVPAFAASNAKTVKVTIRDKQSGHKVTYKVKKGKKLSKKQLRDAKKKMKKWFAEVCSEKELAEPGMGKEFSKMYYVTLPKSANKTFDKNTVIKVSYKKDKSVIRYIDTVSGKIFKRTYIKRGGRVPYYPSAPFHDGYIFRSWAGVRVRKKLNTCRVYEAKAIYVPCTYTIRYAGDGAKGSVPDQKDVKYDQTVTLNYNTFTKTNCVFAGWKSSTGGIYKEGQAVKNLATGGTVTMTAIWQEAPLTSYSISYNLNGGTASNPTSYTRDDYIRLENPTKRGYEFLGWSGTGIKGKSKTVTIQKNSTGNRSYTANWKTLSYTVYFDANGGKGSMSPVYTNADETFTLPANVFTKTRYNFNGWEDGQGHIYQDGQTVKNILYSENFVTLKARWIENPDANLQLTISPNGGKYEGSLEKKVIYGGTGQTIVLSEPTKDGYEFVEWVLKGDGTVGLEKVIKGVKEVEEMHFTFGTSDATLTAKYIRKN